MNVAISAMQLLNLASEMRRNKRDGSSFVSEVAHYMAQHGIIPAICFLRGAWYTGITSSKGVISYDDFKRVVMLCDYSWDDFCNFV